ncbi:MAG: replicative DNA helicase [Bacteroidia bacterium]|nr:replicative DNA helicase [Bacteroidia bacterium]
MSLKKQQIKSKNILLNKVMDAVTGKVQPQAVEVEEALLGAMLLDREALSDVIDLLSPEMFYKEQNGKIFEAIHALFHRSEPVDILTVTQELKRTSSLEMVGGSYYVASLTNKISSAANAEFHARIVIQKHIQRELIRAATEILNESYDESIDVFEMLDKATQIIFKIHDSNVRKQHEKMSSLLKTALEEIQASANKKDGLLGVPSGFVELDRITGGWQKSDLIIIAARPGMGKTAFVLSLARNAAIDFNKPVAIFSLEMSSIQLVKRLISAETGIMHDKILKGNLEDYEYIQLHQRIKHLDQAPIYIDDTPALSIFELRAKARRLKEKHDVEMVIVDYLQLMTAGIDTSGNRVQEISEISRGLKNLAKELNIPIIALSQLSRQVENRQSNSKRPQLSDLRESGSIEQDADQVLFIYRPEYYNIEFDEENRPTKNIAEIIIGKNRHGATGTIRLRFNNALAKFTNLDESIRFKNEEPISGNITENHNFLPVANIKTIPSKNWNNDDDDTPDILGNLQVEEDF